jgi:hypothetical protein
MTKTKKSILSCPHCTTNRPGAASGWHIRQGPAPLLWDRHGTREFRTLPSWVDHPYRVRLDDGRWCYVAEPYELRESAFSDFVFLEGNGYRVSITAWKALHYRGHTVAVHIVCAQGKNL